MFRFVMKGALCALLLISAPAVSAAQEVQAEASDLAARKQVAQQLMQVMYAKEAFPAFQPDFEANMTAAFKGHPQLALMERIYPGSSGRMVKSLVPELQTLILKSLPSLHQQGIDLYSSRLSLDELKHYYAFASSPAGVAFRDGMAKNVDFAKAVKNFDRKGGISAEARDEIQTETAIAAAGHLSDADLKKLMEFVENPASDKFAKVDEEFIKIHAAWSQKLKTDNEAILRSVAVKAISPATQGK
nr:hypothetical protein [uncultured Sphingomonas sp.]